MATENSEEGLKTLKQEYHELRLNATKLESQRQMVRKLEEQCRKGVEKLEKDMTTLPGHLSNSEVHDAKAISNGLRDISAALPKPGNVVLRFILGDISVTLPNRDEKITYKQNYEQFKMAQVTMMFILTLLNLYLQDHVTSSVVHVVSVWFYFTVTLRELVLISNGSKIKWWWMTHHYCSIFMAILLLTWPPGECYNAFRNQFMLFSCLLSFVMGLQFRYQRAKLYREVSMGEKHPMSLSQEHKSSRMSILILCLLAIYVFQLYNGITLLKLFLNTNIDCSNCWQASPVVVLDKLLLRPKLQRRSLVPILGVLFIVLALMNSSTLTIVLKAKQKKSHVA